MESQRTIEHLFFVNTQNENSKKQKSYSFANAKTIVTDYKMIWY